MSDIVDIQRYINRLLTLLDFIIGSSAKGLLMVPQECIPDDMDIKDFAREYVKVNGVILLKKGAGDKLPKQIATNSTNIGAWELFNTEMTIMQRYRAKPHTLTLRQASMHNRRSTPRRISWCSLRITICSAKNATKSYSRC